MPNQPPHRPATPPPGTLPAQLQALASHLEHDAQPMGLVGSAPAFNAALAAVQRVAASMLPVLLLGESGTDKELFARAVHEASPRATSPLVVVDCSGLTETLFESELFGHEKGAFTGVDARKPGLVETAQGGSWFAAVLGKRLALGLALTARPLQRT